MANTVAEAEDDGTRLIEFRVGGKVAEVLDWIREVTELEGDGEIFVRALGSLKMRVELEREGTEVFIKDSLGTRKMLIPIKVKPKPKMKRPRRGPSPK